VAVGLTLRAARLAPAAGPAAGHVSSALFLAGGLAFRFAWVGAGKASARDAEANVVLARQVRPPRRRA
jgi:hypothetical protein